MKKNYNELNDYEKKIIREYKSWCKSKAPFGLKLAKCKQYMKRITKENLQHLV